MIELEISGLVCFASKLLELWTQKTCAIKIIYGCTSLSQGQSPEIRCWHAAESCCTDRLKSKTPTQKRAFPNTDNYRS